MRTVKTPSAIDPPAKGRPLDPSLDVAIREAAIMLLTEQGYGRLSMAAVAKRAGVSTATLYRRWDSKRELILDVATALAEDSLVDQDTGSLCGDLTRLMETKLELWAGDRARTLFSLFGEAAHDAELGAILHQGLFAVTREVLHRILDRAEARAEVGNHVQRAAVMQLFLGAQLIYSGVTLIGPEVDLPSHHIAAQQLAETLVLGLGPRAVGNPVSARPADTDKETVDV